MEFAVAPTRQAEGTVLAVAGEFDIATAPEFSTAVEAALQPRPAALVVDLSATTFADSSACRALVQASRACRRAGLGIEVVCPAGNVLVRRVLELVGLDAVAPLRERLTDTAVCTGAGGGTTAEPSG